MDEKCSKVIEYECADPDKRAGWTLCGVWIIVQDRNDSNKPTELIKSCQYNWIFASKLPSNWRDCLQIRSFGDFLATCTSKTLYYKKSYKLDFFVDFGN